MGTIGACEYHTLFRIPCILKLLVRFPKYQKLLVKIAFFKPVKSCCFRHRRGTRFCYIVVRVPLPKNPKERPKLQKLSTRILSFLAISRAIVTEPAKSAQNRQINGSRGAQIGLNSALEKLRTESYAIHKFLWIRDLVSIRAIHPRDPTQSATSGFKTRTPSNRGGPTDDRSSRKIVRKRSSVSLAELSSGLLQEYHPLGC